MAKRTLGKISDEIQAIKVKEDKLKKDLKDLEDSREIIEIELRKAAEDQGLEKGGGKKSTFSIDEKTVPVIKDFDAFCEYMVENNYFHLIQKRAGEKACQELWELGKVIPGIDKFSFVKVNVKEVK